MKTVVVLVIIVVFSIIALALVGSQPMTYGEIAAAEKQNCIERNGYGGWVGSSGVSLDKFCQTFGQLKALAEERHDHPDRF